MPIDEYDYDFKRPRIETNIRQMPLKEICVFYNQMEFEQKVKSVLCELSEVIYYREYMKKIEFVNNILLSKDILEMNMDIPF